MKALIAVLIIAAILATNTPIACAGGTIMYPHVSTYINARRFPQKDSAEEARIWEDEPVTILEIENGWGKVAIGEAGYAWVCMDYMREYPSDQRENKYTVHSNGRIRVRNEPGGEPTGSYVENGETLDVWFTFEGWARIEAGWVYMGSEYDGYTITRQSVQQPHEPDNGAAIFTIEEDTP